jgi:hypothetical protein
MRPEEHDPKNKAKKKNDHFIDCLRYILNAQPRYFRLEDNDEEEIVYEGTYTKYPTRKTSRPSSSYYNLVER